MCPPRNRLLDHAPPSRKAAARNLLELRLAAGDLEELAGAGLPKVAGSGAFMDGIKRLDAKRSLVVRGDRPPGYVRRLPGADLSAAPETALPVPDRGT